MPTPTPTQSPWQKLINPEDGTPVPPVNPLDAAGSPQSPFAVQPPSAEVPSVPNPEPVAIFSGQTRKNQATNQDTSGSTSQLTRALSPEELQKGLEMLSQMPGLQAQGQDVSAMRAAAAPGLADAGNRTQLQRADLSPVMQLAKSWGGADLLPGYTAPSDTAAKAVGAGSQVATAAGALSNEQVNTLGKLLADKFGVTTGATRGGTAESGTGGNPELGLRMDQIGYERDKDATHAAGEEITKQAPLLPMRNALATIDAMAKKYDTAHTGKLPNFVGIPGTKVQIYNGTPIKGGGPDAEDAKSLDRAITVIMQELNHENFGARLTDTEIESTKKRLSQAQLAGPAAMLKALSELQGPIRDVVTARLGAMQPAARAKLGAGTLGADSFNFDFGYGPKKAAPAPPKTTTPAKTPAAKPAGKDHADADAARQWLKDNPNDPRAPSVRARLEAQ